ncbi:MAG: molybdopterin molybdotransferase MoeA [Sphingopyxis sp.]|nr:molybdopterin molybdotransferase MoeA [Sphingopyxis sp.]
MTALLPVEEAQARLFALAAPLPAETLPLAAALGRYLAAPLIAQRSQPAAVLSAMDGYAIRFADLPGPWRLVGSIAAGNWPESSIATGETMRIFTGAPLPEGADTVLIQEDATAADGIIALTGAGPGAQGQHVRTAGSDFAQGADLAAAGARVTPALIALAAMAGHASLAVGCAPRVALISTGDELVDAGAPLAPGQIPDSNAPMLSALLAAVPAHLGTVQRIGDDRAATIAAIRAASADHDVIVTLGGASVGDHDHVHAAMTSLGAPPAFWKIAMRPGKPLLAGRIGDAALLGLPGNPASAFVTAQLFLLPLLRHLAGAATPLPDVAHAALTNDLVAGGPRRDYLRAAVSGGRITPFAAQDSGLTTALANANALLIREIGAPPQPAGAMTPYIAL